MRLVHLALILVVVLGLLVGCRDDKSPAAEMVVERVELSSRGEHARVWETLHPAHQAIVSQEQFIECGQQSDEVRSPAIEGVEVVSEEASTKTLPEIGEVEVTTVVVDIEQHGETRNTQFDVVQVDGGYRWVLGETALTMFGSGICPVMPRTE
jgi:hypothetical protein